MENNAQLLKGVLEYCVLRLIEKEPTYGYEIVMQLKQVGFVRDQRKHAVSAAFTPGAAGEGDSGAATFSQGTKPEVLCDHRKGDGFSFGFSTGMEPPVRFGRKDFSGG